MASLFETPMKQFYHLKYLAQVFDINLWSLFFPSEGEVNENFSLRSINKQLRDVVRLLLISGAPFSMNNSRQRIVQLYCRSINLLRIVNFLFICTFVQFFFRLNSILLTFHSFNACALICFAMVTHKRRDIVQSLKTVSRLAPASTRKKWKMWIMLAIQICGMGIGSASMALAVSSEDLLDSIPSPIYFFGWTFSDEQRTVLLTFFKFSMTFTVFSNISICSGTLILYCTSFYYLSEAVSAFGHALKKRFNRGLFHEDSMAQNVRRFQKIVDMVKEMNDALAYSVLFLYASAIMCIFSALSVALNVSKGNFTFHVFATAMFSGAMYGFLTLTYFGSLVTSKSNRLCDLLHECAMKMISARCSVKELTCFGILAESIRAADLHLTGGDMFVIQKGMFLSVAGVMITYGILIFQLDNVAH